MLTGLAAALYPADSILRAPDGVIASFKAPIMQSIVSLIFIFAALVGLVYGIACGKFNDFKNSAPDTAISAPMFDAPNAYRN